MSEVLSELGILMVTVALGAWLVTRLRQPLIVGYVAIGFILGPGVTGWIDQTLVVEGIARIGVTLLLFLAAMVLHPNRLHQLFKGTLVVTLAGCACTALPMALLFYGLGFGLKAAFYGGAALMFSSTILVIKLLPTTTLHQRRLGSLCIAVLIAQDLAAVVLLLFTTSRPDHGVLVASLLVLLRAGVFVLLAGVIEQFILRPMMRQADRYHEVLYVISMGWCLGWSVLAEHTGLSYEVGAFIAGLVMARSPLSRFVSEELKPLRDFFLMFFFVGLGIQLDIFPPQENWWVAPICVAVILLIRPTALRLLFQRVGEQKVFAREAGIRLTPCSEFGLILIIAAQQAGAVDMEFSRMIQVAILITMVVSTYWVTRVYPSPLGTSANLKQD